ncbi:MAG: arylesterase [Geminicoccaceae bacterium]
MVHHHRLLKVVLSAFAVIALVNLILLHTHSSVRTAAICRISVLGDSLTAAYGIAWEEGFPAQLVAALTNAGYPCDVIDAGVSGDTTAGGLARLGWVLADRPTHVIIELGANDGLRGLPTDQMEANLDAIVARLKGEDIAVFLTGMLPPPNLGRDYTEAFSRVYQDLADRHAIPLYPFFLDGVAGNPALNQPDQLHPLPEGIIVIVKRILPHIIDWLDASI